MALVVEGRRLCHLDETLILNEVPDPVARTTATLYSIFDIRVLNAKGVAAQSPGLKRSFYPG